MDIRSKIRGCLYGMAVGDALGIGAEFMTRHEVKMHYPDGLTNYDQFVRDAHRCQWKRGEWSNDMELPLRMVERITSEGRFDVEVIKEAIYEWFKSNPRDMVPNMRWLRNHEEWRDNPFEVCREVWHKINHFEASNETLGRALVTAMVSDNLIEDTRDVVLLTHCQKRCVGTSCVIAHTARELFYNNRIAELDELKEIAAQSDVKIIPYLEIARKGKLEGLDLDDEDTLWYARKTMAAALWCLWHCSDTEQALQIIIHCGGDADTNASLACGLLGLRFGEKRIPKYLVDGLYDKQRLVESTEKFADFVESRRR